MPAATQLPDGTWDYGNGKVFDPKKKAWSAGGSGAQQYPAGGPQPVSFESTATDDPHMTELWKKWQERLSTDTTKRAIDRSNLGIADAAALGAADAKANMSSRGVLGTGAGDTFLQKRVFQPAQRAAAGAAADISLGRERDLDALTMAGQGIASGIAGNNLDQRRFGLDQWSAQQADARARSAMEMEQRNQELAQWMALNNMLGSFDDTFGPAAPGGYPALPKTTNAYGTPHIGGV